MTVLSTQLLRLSAAFAACWMVTVTAAASQPVPAWRLIEEWRVSGSEDGKYEFARIRDLDLAPNGDLVVLDTGDQRIVFVSPAGRIVRVVGRAGGGPGEFRSASGVAIAPNGDIVVADFQNARFTILSDTGAYVRSVTTGRSVYSTMWRGAFVSSGQLLDPVYAPDPQAPRERWFPRSTDLTPVDTVAMMPCTAGDPGPGVAVIPLRTNPPRGLVARRPFTSPIIEKVLDRDGFQWEPRAFGARELVRRSLRSCDSTATARLSGERPAVPERERNAAARSILDHARSVQAEAPEVGEIPRHMPWYNALVVDSANQLWVDRSDVSGRRFEVYSAAGAPVAHVPIEVPLSAGMPTVITRDRVYTWTQDADGFVSLIALRIDRAQR